MQYLHCSTDFRDVGKNLKSCIKMAATGLIPYASTFAMFAEVLEEKCPVPIRRIGVEDKFGHSGAMKEVMEDFGLCASNIVKQTKDLKSKYRRFSRPTSTAMHKKASAKSGRAEL